MTGTSLVDLDGRSDNATGTQPLCFIEHSKHDMRIGYYRDTYVRTDDGWRLKTRAMTFIRRSGDHDSGRPHAIGGPRPMTCTPTSRRRPSSGRSLRGVARRQRPDATAWRPLAGRAPRATLPRAERAVRRRLDALGLARIGRRTRRPADPAGRSSARRSSAADSTSRAVLDARSADADDDRLRTPELGRGDGAAPAVRAARPGARASPSRARAATWRR